MLSRPGVRAQQLSLGVFQFAPRLREIGANIETIAAAAQRAGADLLVTPELSLTGYDVRDDAHQLARALPIGASAAEVWGHDWLAPGQRILAGAIERNHSTVPHNAAVLLDCGTVSFVHRKVYLPTYGMFDEGRYFGRGNRVELFEVNGWRVGVLICEDFWHPMLAYLHAIQGADVILVMAAAPGRGAWIAGEEGSFFASSDSWLRIGRAYAQLHGIYVVVCNRCGVEGGVTFAGESFVVSPNASVTERAGVGEELLTTVLDAAELNAARVPYAHIRDEDTGLAIREMKRIMGDS